MQTTCISYLAQQGACFTKADVMPQSSSSWGIQAAMTEQVATLRCHAMHRVQEC